MDSVPHALDPQTRNAVSRRIIAHVTVGWPRLGEPLVRHRGQYCYVAALLPGHCEPTPILRLRYQGSPDAWAIGIYQASTSQYSETELPGSFGPVTGTLHMRALVDADAAARGSALTPRWSYAPLRRTGAPVGAYHQK